MKDMIAYSKANPGKVSVGTTDAIGRLMLESLRGTTQADLTQVSYKAAGGVAGDVVGGHIQMGLLTPPAVLGFWRDKRVTALALTGPSRIASMPGVPTVAESAGIQDYNIQTWFALAGPAGLPRPIVERLQREMQKILADPDVRDKLQAQGMDPATDANPARVTAVMNGDSERLGKLLEQVGIKPE
jgi:tripartite-type tricarboxylate transporter receptor subunit TctC